MKTLNDILEDWFTDEPLYVAKDHLHELLNDIEACGGFRGIVLGPDDIMDNLEHPRES